MYQNDRGSYRKQETISHKFTHSCLGQLIIGAAIVGCLLLLATLTCPSRETMESEIKDDIKQCILEGDSLRNDWIDDVVANAGYIFTKTETDIDSELEKNFVKYNQLKFYEHTFFSTVYLHNNLNTQGKRCGMGIFGIVFPMINYNDLLLHDERMQNDTINQRLIMESDGEYFGENPGLEPYRYKGE